MFMKFFCSLGLIIFVLVSCSKDIDHSKVDLPSEELSKLAKEDSIREALKWGFVDVKNGKTRLPFIYQDVRSFIDGYAVVKKDDKWGIIDTVGQWILQPAYEEIIFDGIKLPLFVKPLNEENFNLVSFQNPTKIKGQYPSVSRFNADKLAIVSIGDKKCVINEVGDTLICALQNVQIKEKSKIIILKNYNKYSAFKEGKVILDNFDYLSHATDNNFLIFEKSDAKGVCKVNGDTIYINCDNVQDVQNKHAIILNNNFFNLYEINSRKILSLGDFEHINNLYDDVWMVKKGSKHGILNSNATWSQPATYDLILASSHNLLTFKKSEKWGYLNQLSNKTFGKYDFAFPYSGKYARVMVKEKFGVVDEEGTLLWENNFIELKDEGNSLMAAQIKTF